MASTIKLKRSTTAGSVPSLSEGEVAVNLKDKILYVANSTVTFELARNTANNGLVLHDGSGNETRIVANNNLASNYTLTLPAVQGSDGEFLKRVGSSGALEWGSAGAGDVVASGATSRNDKLAVWVSDSAIEGDSNLTFDGTTFTVGGADSTVFSATVAGVVDVSGVTNFNDTTTSTSTSTGAVIVDGGVGIAENLNVGGNATITGDLTVNGTTTTLNVNDIIVEDAIIALANTNSGDTIDIGIAGTYNDGATKWFAMVRDASETDEAGTGKIIRVLDDITTNPTTTTTITGGSLAQLDAVIDGGTY